MIFTERWMDILPVVSILFTSSPYIYLSVVCLWMNVTICIGCLVVLFGFLFGFKNLVFVPYFIVKWNNQKGRTITIVLSLKLFTCNPYFRKRIQFRNSFICVSIEIYIQYGNYTTNLKTIVYLLRIHCLFFFMLYHCSITVVHCIQETSSNQQC